MIRYCFFLLLFFLPPVAYAQLEGRAYVDSLERVLPGISEDTVRIKVLLRLANDYNSIDPNKGLQYGERSLELANTLDKNKLIIRAYSAIGLNYQARSDYHRALEYYNRAMLICSAKEQPRLYGDLISHIAVVLQEMGELDRALEYQLRSLKLNESLKDTMNIAGDLGNIGIAYMLKKDYERALDHDLRSLEMFRLMNDKNGVAHNYGNIGNVYKEYGNHVLALEYDTRSLELFRELGDNGGMAINLGNIGEVYLESVRVKDTASSTSAILLKGSRQELLLSAVRYLEESIALSKQIEQLDNIIEFSAALSDAYRLSGNYERALTNFKTYVLYKDSVHSDENKLKVANMNTDREQTLKEKQIEINELQNANKRKERVLYIVSLCLLGIGVGIITRKFIVQIQRNRLLALERKRNLERIEKQREVMGHIAYAHSHDVSGQVATILGLVDVFNTENYADPDNKVVIDGIGDTARQLDIIVKDMIVKENMLNKSKKGLHGTT